MLLLLILIIFAVTMALTLSFLYFMVEAPLAHRKIMTRFLAVQEMSARNEVVPDILRKELLSDVPLVNRVLGQIPGIVRLRLFLEQGAVRMQVGTFCLIVLAILLFVLVLTLAIGLPAFDCIPLAIGFSTLPILIVAAKRRARLRKFEELFPEATELLGRAVRAGHAFTTGFELIGKELPDPVGEEFRIAFQQQNLGLPLRDALENMTVRVPLADVRIFVSALQIQRESGGNLGEILDNIARVIRERFVLRRQIQTFTAEGRISSYVLTSLPFAALAAMHFVNPKYLTPLFTDPGGQKALMVAALLQVVGYVVINRLIRFKV